MMRGNLTTLLVVFAACATLPACSLLFDGSGYRADGGPADGGMGCTQASCGENYQYCDMISGMCLPGCNDNADCRNGPTDAGGGALACNPGTHLCVPAVGCDMDMDCNGPGMGVDNFCDMAAGVCRECDGDMDGFAPVGGESCVTRLVTVIGPNDCDDGNEDWYPGAFPDCNGGTDDTCDPSGMRARMLLLESFELGAMPSAVLSESAEGEVHVHVMDHDENSAQVVVIHRATSTSVPRWTRLDLRRNMSSPMAVSGDFPMWGDIDPSVSQLVTIPSPDGAGLLVATLDRSADGNLSRYSALLPQMEGPMAASGSGNYRFNLGVLADTVKSASAVSVGLGAAIHGMYVSGAGMGDYEIVVALRADTMIAGAVYTPTGLGRGRGIGGPGFWAFEEGDGFDWGAAIAGMGMEAYAFNHVSLGLTEGRVAFASRDDMGARQAMAFAVQGPDRLGVAYACETGGCSTATATLSSVAVSDNGLLVADTLRPGRFLLAYLGHASGAGRAADSVVVAAANPVPLIDGSLVIDLPGLSLAGVSQLDLGTRDDARFATVAYVAGGPSGRRVGAVRVCYPP